MNIVVTGAGMVTPIGIGIEEFGCGLYSGKSGVRASEQYPGIFAAEILGFTPEKWLGPKGLRVLDRGARLLATAAALALEGQDSAESDECGIALVSGSMFGSVHSIVSFDWTGITDGPNLVNPMEFPNTVINSASGQTAIRHRLRGVNTTISAGGASGLHALAYAADCLRLGRATRVLAGGVEELCQETVLAFRKNGLLSASGAVRPFDSARDGVAIGEGAVLCSIESSETAEAAGSTPWFEICGFGSSYDGWNSNSFHLQGRGASRAIRLALADAEVEPKEIGFIVASAGGSRAGDQMEHCALERVFGDRLESLPVFAPKAVLGDMLGAAGAAAALIAGLVFQRAQLPRTSALLSASSAIEGSHALVNAFGCDGNNASMVIGPCRN